MCPLMFNSADPEYYAKASAHCRVTDLPPRAIGTGAGSFAHRPSPFHGGSVALVSRRLAPCCISARPATQEHELSFRLTAMFRGCPPCLPLLSWCNGGKWWDSIACHRRNREVVGLCGHALCRDRRCAVSGVVSEALQHVLFGTEEEAVQTNTCREPSQQVENLRNETRHSVR